MTYILAVAIETSFSTIRHSEGPVLMTSIFFNGELIYFFIPLIMLCFVNKFQLQKLKKDTESLEIKIIGDNLVNILKQK